MLPLLPPLTLNKRRGQNQYYDEVLAEGVLPLRMMQIPSGTFTMGSPETELERLDREGPQHEVTLTQFFMANYPVAQSQWRVVATEMQKVNRELKPDPSYFKGSLNPVEQVSWHEAVEFCDRLTLHTNRRYRLPTEAEWEYACRAGTKTPFHFGETITTNVANYCGTDNDVFDLSGSYGKGPKGEYREQTTPVNLIKYANAFGLCDMHGNVWEWCQDHYHDNYKGAPSNGRAWLNGDKKINCILRGGSWNHGPGYCRSAYRIFFSPHETYNDIGFRIVYSTVKIVV